MGSSGAHPNNVSRDFFRNMSSQRLPRPQSLSIPLLHSTVGRFWKPMKMIYPHEMFSCIYHNYPEIWSQCIYGSEDRCREFWRAVSGGQQFRNHQVRFLPKHCTHAIPLVLHGDGTPVAGIGKAWGKVMDIWSLSSILGSGPTLLRNFLIFAIHTVLQSFNPQHHSLNAFWKRLSWSLWWCWLGRNLTHDWNGDPILGAQAGEPLCGGFFFCLWVLASDLDYFYKSLRLMCSNNNIPCCLCPANITSMPWYHFAVDASWIRNIYTEEAFRTAGLSVSGVFSIVGVTNQTIHPDWMHCKSLGLDKGLLGSV